MSFMSQSPFASRPDFSKPGGSSGVTGDKKGGRMIANTALLRPGRRLLVLLALNCGSYFAVLHCQTLLPPAEHLIHPAKPQFLDVCAEPTVPRPLREALQLACLRSRDQAATVPVDHAIVIGFVGGFVSRDDAKHPEVLFAAYLRHRYPSAVHAEVFSNHQGKQALRCVLSLLDLDHDGALSASEKQQAKIIIYGHSWGASQAVTLARELDREGIPVLLTIQVDSIRKLGQNDSRIPANVQAAVNLYQSRGLLHGRSQVVPEDQATTRIDNVQMTYEHRRINCSNYPWLARVLNKPHHQIENDPRVWDQIAAIVESELSAIR
jgi:hypothetical protein